MTIIDEILWRYESLQLEIPPDSIALKVITETLRDHGYVVITKSLYRELSKRPVWAIEEATQITQEEIRMAYTTNADIEKMHRMAQDQKAAFALFAPDQITEPALQGTITIEVKSGAVIDVRGLPDGYQYEILDHNEESEPIREALYLATVNILVRAASPGHAAGIIIFALSDYDRDDGALVDWDYIVQDGERQVPKCVSLDLGPENIAELLDYIAARGERAMSIDQLVGQLRAEGYQSGAPSPEIGQQDAAESERIPCPKCEGQVTYLGFHKPGSYRAFVLCADCGHLVEF